jgi:hypothetical protein
MVTANAAQPARYGLLSVAFGFLAFAAVIGHFFVGPLDPPAPVEVSIAEKAASIRDATVAALKGEEYEAESNPPARTMDDYLTYAFLGLALLAILLAITSFIRHEPWRPGAAGVALGVLAVSFQFAVAVFFGLLCALVLAAVIDKLDFGL